MFWQQQKKTQLPPAGVAALAIGTTLGVATAVFLGLRARRHAPGLATMPRPVDVSPQLVRLEESVVDALAADDVAGHAPIEVEAIAAGIVELTGTVETAEEAQRVVEVTQAVAGVRTVLNRLDIAEDLAHIADARRRAAAGEAGFRETRWYGMGAGMGGRRQSRDTDPDRPNEKVHRITREYEAEIQRDDEPGPPRVDGANGNGEQATQL